MSFKHINIDLPQHVCGVCGVCEEGKLETNYRNKMTTYVSSTLSRKLGLQGCVGHQEHSFATLAMF